MRPRLLDLFCGAGGAAMGYFRAGFEVVGVDIEPMPNYPFEFHQADALEFPLDGFDAIHASPPCQHFSKATRCHPGLADEHPHLLHEMRRALRRSGLPYVIENVIGAPLVRPVGLCGTMFGLELYRHRLFESNVPLVAPPHPPHLLPSTRAGHWRPGTVMSVVGHFTPVWKGREIMGIDWMSRDELAQAIPPAYTQWIGEQLLGS